MTLARWSRERVARVRRSLRSRSIHEEDLVLPRDSDRFIGGTIGRSGTSWLRDSLGALLEPEWKTIPEIGFFPLSVFRNAPVDYWSPMEASRRHYLRFLRGFLTRTSYDLRRIFGGGPPGLSGAVPVRIVHAAFDVLERELEEARTLEECHLRFGRFYSRLLNAHALLRAGTTNWISKEPPYGKYADTLHRMLPDCRLVVMVRDGRDVVLSMARKGWRDGDIAGCADQWNGITALSLEALGRIPAENLLLLRYEDLVGRHGESIEAVLRFFGVPDAGEVAARVEVPGYAFRPRERAVRRWDEVVTAEEAEYFDRTCGPLMARLGYGGGAGADARDALRRA